MSPRLRDRLADTVAPGEEPGFNYPDIHADPAKIYHDRFGVDEEHDAFIFPWLMNLIFEDRWLLAEKDPAEAVKNQLRRRMKIDIRDPDPDTANFPNGAYTLPKGRIYIENSPLGLLRREQEHTQDLPVGISASLRADRQPRVPHLLQRVDRPGSEGATEGRPLAIRHWLSTSRPTSGKRIRNTIFPRWVWRSIFRRLSARPLSTAAPSPR